MDDELEINIAEDMPMCELILESNEESPRNAFDSLPFQVVPLPINECDMDTKVLWTREMTKMLLDEYVTMLDSFRNPEKKQKDLWTIIATKLREKGHDVDWYMCDRKFRNLKTTYRTIYYSNRSEQSKRRWEFYECMLKLIPPNLTYYPGYKKFINSANYGTQNFIRPDKIQSQKPPVNHSVPKYNYDMKQSILETMSNNINDKFDKFLKSDAPDWFKKFYKHYKCDQEIILDKIQNMHNETRKIEFKKIKLLQEVISLLKSNKK